VPHCGGVRVKMDIDRYGLWSDRGDIGVRDLWDTYARFPYLPRLLTMTTLYGAISDGTSNMNWSQETFAYAEAYDDTTWVGIRTNEHVNPSPGGLLVRPTSVPAPSAPDDEHSDDGGSTGNGDGSTADDDGSGGGSPTVVLPTRFFATFELDPVRGIRQLGEILEHVVARLGPNVELRLDIDSSQSDGYDDTTRRVVSENANNLDARSAEFE